MFHRVASRRTDRESPQRALYKFAGDAKWEPMASRASTDSGRTSWHLRCLRGVLSTLITLAVVLTLFNCGCCSGADDAEGTQTVFVAQTNSDAAGKPGPLSIAPHCCHCLAHATTVAPQVNSVAIPYVASPYRMAAAPVPEPADLTSPFEPPRA